VNGEDYCLWPEKETEDGFEFNGHDRLGKRFCTITVTVDISRILYKWDVYDPETGEIHDSGTTKHAPPFELDGMLETLMQSAWAAHLKWQKEHGNG
jgi:hypothetical protein